MGSRHDFVVRRLKAPGYLEDRDQYIIRALIGGKDDVTGAVFLPTEVGKEIAFG